ncbi:MAG TPA: hypothetical protein VKI99_13850 [Candidatus Dormibacteraeota bacterium]|nr:hypothetical protein [Candidatus Dormibacteraeota bacterium]
MKVHAPLAGVLAGLRLAVGLAGCGGGPGARQPAGVQSANPAQGQLWSA